MREITGIVAIGALALLLIAGSLFGLHDTSIFTGPPEAVAESFVRQIVAGRYERAIPYLTNELAEQLPVDSLRSFGESIRKRLRGEALAVHGDPMGHNADTARAAARIDSKETTVSIGFVMVLEEGEWKIETIEN